MGYRHAVIEEDDTLASDIPSTTVGPRCQAPGIIYLYLYSIAYICRDFQSTSPDLVEPKQGVTGETAGSDYIRYDIPSYPPLEIPSYMNNFTGIIYQKNDEKQIKKNPLR